MDGGERTDGETREAWKKGWESHFVDVDAQITRVQSTNSFEPSERRGEGSCDPLTCRYTRAAPASKFHGAIDFARDNDRILARRKSRVEFDFLFFFFLKIVSIRSNMGDISTHRNVRARFDARTSAIFSFARSLHYVIARLRASLE